MSHTAASQTLDCGTDGSNGCLRVTTNLVILACCGAIRSLANGCCVLLLTQKTIIAAACAAQSVDFHRKASLLAACAVQTWNWLVLSEDLLGSNQDLAEVGGQWPLRLCTICGVRMLPSHSRTGATSLIYRTFIRTFIHSAVPLLRLKLEVCIATSKPLRMRCPRPGVLPGVDKA